MMAEKKVAKRANGKAVWRVVWWVKISVGKMAATKVVMSAV